MDVPTLADLSVIASQIGRQPRGVTGIPCRCSYGYPQAIRVHPIVAEKPFPTLYWLTCPFLGRAVDRLEAAGWIGQMEDELRADPSLNAAFQEARAAYIEERITQLSPEERGFLEARGMLPALQERGIGGITETDRVKCLHLHVAHALSGSNPIGKRILDYLGERECVAENVICSVPEGTEQTDQINR